MKNYTTMITAISNQETVASHAMQMLNCPCSEYVEYEDYCAKCIEAADFLSREKIVRTHSNQINDCLCTDVLDPEDYCPACTLAVNYFDAEEPNVRHPQTTDEEAYWAWYNSTLTEEEHMAQHQADMAFADSIDQGMAVYSLLQDRKESPVSITNFDYFTEQEAKHIKQLDNCMCGDVLSYKEYCPACKEAAEFFENRDVDFGYTHQNDSRPGTRSELIAMYVDEEGVFTTMQKGRYEDIPRREYTEDDLPF